MTGKSGPITAVATVLGKFVGSIWLSHMTDHSRIPEIAGYCLQFHFTQVLNLEGKDVAAGLGADLLAVGIESHSILVGIDLDFGDRLHPIHKTLAADMDKGFLAPPGLIDIEGILLDLSVKGHQAFMIHTGLTALIPGVRGKVEHIPQMGRPHKGTFFKEVQHILIVLALIFFGLVASSGMGTVEIGHTFTAVLRIAQTAIGVLPVEKVHP